MYCRLSRCSAARRSGSGLYLGGPTKVNARKSFLFAEGSLKVEITVVFSQVKLTFRFLNNNVHTWDSI